MTTGTEVNMNIKRCNIRKINGGESIKFMIKVSPKDNLKQLALKSKQRREKMKNLVFTEKDKAANKNFNDLEKEIYSNIFKY